MFPRKQFIYIYVLNRCDPDRDGKEVRIPGIIEHKKVAKNNTCKHSRTSSLQ